MKRITTNILIFLWAIIIAIWMFYLTENSSLFSASILSLQDAETIRAKSRDIWYKNEWNILDTFVSEELWWIDSMTFSVIYDKDNTNLDLDKIDAQTQYKIISNNEWTILIKFTNFSGLEYDYNQSLFELPFSWDKSTVLISEGIVSLISWENKNLAIWILNKEKKTHH